MLKTFLRALLKPFSFVPALMMMYLIFSFSAQDGTASGNLSYKVSEIIVESANEAFELEWSDDQIDYYIERIHHPVRKLAHMTEYFLLAVSVSFPLYVYGVRGLWLPILAGGFCVAFAALDEYHQLFVPGRGGQLRDVFIDLSGSALALALCLLILGLWRTRRGNPLPALLMAGAACACAGLSFLLPQSLAGKVLGLSVRLAPIGTQVLSACLLVLAAGLAMLALVPLMGQRCRGMQRAD